MSNKIPITVFTGYLGSGKTTIILNLIKQLRDDYKVVWLKNEYGDVSIDSELAKENNIEVTEMMNGCLCCVLVGRLHDAIDQILRDFAPDRIIVESSGTAYPMPIVMEIKRIEGVVLDGVINVIDALNFSGYRDKGYVAKMQAEYTDLIIINKAGLVDERTLEDTLDDVYELNPTTPKVKTNDGNVSKELLLGLDSKLIDTGNDPGPPDNHDHTVEGKHPDEVEVFTIQVTGKLNLTEIEEGLKDLDRKGFVRIKGIVQDMEGKWQMLNWVFGRLTWQVLENYKGDGKVVFMGFEVGALEGEMVGIFDKM